MAAIIESNEYFDCQIYPEEGDKQGIMIKGSADEYRIAVECMREALGRKDARERKDGNWSFKITQPKVEKNSTKSTISIKELGQWAKCALQIFKSGTITIARVKHHTFEVAQDFAAHILIPMLRTLIEEAERGDGKKLSGQIGAIVNAESDCSQCGDSFKCVESLREHIEDMHVMTDNAKRKRFN